MPIDLDLLQEAWPDGCLDIRGVATIDGWERHQSGWTAPTDRVQQHLAEAYSTEGLVEILTSGDLLPNVDPADTATWACLLKDLAEAAGVAPKPGQNLLWVKVPSARVVLRIFYNWGGWQLAVGDWQKTTRIGPLFEIDTDDPAEALVRARIQLRKTSAGGPVAS